MKTTNREINNDIHVLCAKARSFPAGIMEAFSRIENADPAFCSRTFYGLSRGNSSGGIDYWAAVEQHEPGEKDKEGLATAVIKEGTYASIEVRNFREDTAAIGTAFRELLKHPQLDRNSFCVEIYENDNVVCMVRIHI